MNYYLEDLCCFCLSSLSNSNEKYRDGSRESPDTTTHFDKLKTTLIELSTVLETDSRLCKKCCETIDFIYDFNKTCLKNIKILSSYKNILKENLTKKQCNLYVDLNKSNQYNQTAISSTIVKMEPLESTFDNVDNNLSENYLNESVEVKEEIGTQCESNETFETCWLVPEIKMEAEEIESEEERTNEIDEQMDDESLKPNIQDSIQLFEEKKVGINEVKCPEQPEEHVHEVGEEVTNENPGPSDSSIVTFNCLTCNTTFKQNIINQNTLIHTDLKPYKCDICEKSFAEGRGLKQHMFTHMSDKPYKCNICERSFHYKSILDRHIVTHTDDKPYKCNICEKPFSHKYTLEKHLLNHTDETAHKCNICKKILSASSIKQHMLIHTGEKPYECSICEKSFHTSTNLKQHMLKHTGEKTHKCNICNKLFGQKSKLNIHMLRHTGDKPHKCDICGKLYSIKSELNRHLLTHREDKSPLEKCEFCGKMFRFASSLKRHMFIHTGEKPHKCHICEKLFITKQHLDKHILGHTGEKPYKCNICEKLFITKQYLDKHLRTHTGEKPHICEICEKSYVNKRDLDKHLLKHSGESYVPNKQDEKPKSPEQTERTQS